MTAETNGRWLLCRWPKLRRLWMPAAASGLLLVLFFPPIPSSAQDRLGNIEFSVIINASNARTKQPIRSVRVIPTSFNGNRAVTWQSQYMQQIDALPGLFEMRRGWQQTQLRIEADGYRPLVTKPLPRELGIQLDVELEPDLGIGGRILTPDGQPAKAAEIAVCTRTNEVTVRGGALQYGGHGQRLRKLEQTAEDGTFAVPAEVDEWVLVVAHETGYAERTAEQFASKTTITLEPWGRLQGSFAVAGQPVAGHAIHIGAGRGDTNAILHYSAPETITAADGGFSVDHLPPVEIYVTPAFQHGDASYNLLWFSGLVEIKAGGITRITLPRRGQPLVGKLVLPADLELGWNQLDVELSIALRPPSVSLGINDPQNGFAAYSDFMKTDLGKLFRRESVDVQPDGTFRVDQLPESHYVLQAMVYPKPREPNGQRGAAVARLARRVQVPYQSALRETCDLGEVPLTRIPPEK